MKIAFFLLVLLLAVPELTVVRAQTDRYSCPMHPNVVYSKPGKCPKCGMTLVKRDAKTEAKAEHAEDAETKSAEAFSSLKIADAQVLDQNGKQLRSEERRVGKECR